MKYDNYIIAVIILQVKWVRFLTKRTKENLSLVLNTAHMKLKCKIKEVCVFGSQGLECLAVWSVNVAPAFVPSDIIIL